MTKYRDEPTSNESDAELADRLNEITNGAGTLMLALPMEFVVGRGYETIVSTWYPDGLPLVSTYYDRRKAAGAVLRDGRWVPEHSIEDERAYLRRMAEYHGQFAASVERRLANLPDGAP